MCDQDSQVVPVQQVDDIDEVHQLDPVHQVDHKDECSKIISLHGSTKRHFPTLKKSWSSLFVNPVGPSYGVFLATIFLNIHLHDGLKSSPSTFFF